MRAARIVDAFVFHRQDSRPLSPDPPSRKEREGERDGREGNGVLSMQNDGKRSAPIPMTSRNSAILRAADSLAETREFRESIEGEAKWNSASPRISRVPVDVRLWAGPLENVSFAGQS